MASPVRRCRCERPNLPPEQVAKLGGMPGQDHSPMHLLEDRCDTTRWAV